MTVEPEDRVLAPAVDAAFRVAEAGLAAVPPRRPPRALAGLVGFRKRPATAQATVRRVLERDAEFRRLVAEETETNRLPAAAAAFLERPDGWETTVQAAVDALAEAESADRTRRDLDVALERLDSVEAELARTRSAANEQRTRAERAEEDRDRAVASLDQLTEEAERLRGERTRAVRELGEERRRGAEVRAELEAALADASDGVENVTAASRGTTGKGESARVVNDAPTVRSAVVAALAEQLAAGVESLGSLIGDLVDAAVDHDGDGVRTHALGTPGHPPVDASADAGPVAAPGGRTEPVRRPPNPGRGLVMGTAEWLDAVLRIPTLTMWVDGYNASMALWSHLGLPEQRSALTGMLEQLARTTGVSIRLVFDGDGTPSPGRRASRVVDVRFSPEGVEADDVILDDLALVEPSIPAVVVSGDRRVRDGARALGAAAVSPSELKALM